MGKQSRSHSKRRKPKRKVVGFNETLRMIEDLTKVSVAASVGLKVIEATKK